MKMIVIALLVAHSVYSQSYLCSGLGGSGTVISTDPTRGPSSISVPIAGTAVAECDLDDERLRCGVRDTASDKRITDAEIGAQDHSLMIRAVVTQPNQSSFFGFQCRDTSSVAGEDKYYQCHLEIPGRESRDFTLSSDVGIAEKTLLENGNKFECGSTTYGLTCWLNSSKIESGGTAVYTEGIAVPYGTRRFMMRQAYGDGFAKLFCQESGILPNATAEQPKESVWKKILSPKQQLLPYMLRAAAFTGKEYVVATAITGGEAYNPATNTWRPFTFDSDFVTLTVTTKTLWDGREMLFCPSISGNLFAYNPELGKSRNIQLGFASGRTCALVDGKVFLWGGFSVGSIPISPAVLYDPMANLTQPISSQGEPTAVASAFAVAIGRDVIVWGGRNKENMIVNEGAVYHSSTDRWTPMSTVGAPCPRSSASNSFHFESGNPYETTVDSTGTEMLVWGGLNESCGLMNEGALYSPLTDSWRPMSTIGAPPRGRGYATAFANGKLLVWGGRTRRLNWMASAWSYDPVQNRWSPFFVSNLWTQTGSLLLAGANEMLLIGGATLLNERPEIGYVINGFQ